MVATKKTARRKTAAKKVTRRKTADKHRKAESVPIQTPVFSSVLEMQRSIYLTIAHVLQHSDVAYREDRTLQRMMRHDPDVMSPLLQRQYAVALLEWNIIPEDVSDERQRDQADGLKSLIENNMRRRHDFWRHELEAVWFGRSGSNVIYDRVRGSKPATAGESGIAVLDTSIAPIGWRPYHPDSVAFTDQGEMGLRVGHEYKGEKVIGPDGYVKMLTPLERKASVLHVFNQQAPDYDVAQEAAYFYGGRGLRDVVWFQWLMKQMALRIWMKHVEVYGLGIRVGRYPYGDPGGQSAMEDVMNNLQAEVTQLIPYMQGNPDAFGIDIDFPKSGHTNSFVDLVEGYLAGQIKEIILGQTATTEATNTGLGSDVGTRHAETFQRIIKFDALSLGDTLTHELVQPLHEWNYGATPYRPRFEFTVEDVDSEKWMQGIKDFVELGGRVPSRQVAGRLGVDDPLEGEEVLEKQDEFGGFGDFGDESFAFSRVRQIERALKA